MERSYKISTLLIGCYLVFQSCSDVRTMLPAVVTPVKAYVAEMSLRQQLVDTARHYLFVREATGQNDGYWIEKWQKNVGLKKKDGWCTAYAVSMHMNCGIPIPRTGYSPALFTQNVVHRSSDWRRGFVTKPGQVAGFSGGKRIDHSAIIEQQIGSDVFFIEGNYSNSVRRVVRPFDMIYVIADYIEPIKK